MSRLCTSCVLQVVDFLATLFQRACVGLDRGPPPGLVTLIDSETLSMGMGLLASLLSEPQVPSTQLRRFSVPQD